MKLPIKILRFEKRQSLEMLFSLHNLYQNWIGNI